VLSTLVRHHKEQSMNKFRRITLATIISGAAAGIGFKALAHGRRHGHGPIDPADLDAHLERMLKHLYVEVDATEAQKQQLEPIVKQAAKDLLPMREHLHAGRRDAIALLSQERVDRAALEALRAKQIGLADDASRRLTRAVSEVAEVLTPAQRKELAAHFVRQHGRWGHG
jgi:Spy/CpxP family protein refolding chaperone